MAHTLRRFRTRPKSSKRPDTRPHYFASAEHLYLATLVTRAYYLAMCICQPTLDFVQHLSTQLPVVWPVKAPVDLFKYITAQIFECYLTWSLAGSAHPKKRPARISASVFLWASAASSTYDLSKCIFSQGTPRQYSPLRANTLRVAQIASQTRSMTPLYAASFPTQYILHHQQLPYTLSCKPSLRYHTQAIVTSSSAAPHVSLEPPVPNIPHSLPKSTAPELFPRLLLALELLNWSFAWTTPKLGGTYHSLPPLASCNKTL